MTNSELKDALKSHFKLDVEHVTSHEKVPSFLGVTQTVTKVTKYVVAKFGNEEISRVPIDVEIVSQGF